MTKPEPNPLYMQLKKLFRKKGKHKMNEICATLGLVKDDEAVSSALSAKVRLQLGKLLEAKVIVREGEKATTTYSKA